MANDNTIYTATFKLEQQGLDGMVTPSMTLSHSDLGPQKSPAIFELMSHICLDFLRDVNYLDEDGELLTRDKVPTKPVKA